VAISSREVAITSETARRHCYSPPTVNAIEIRPKQKRQVTVVPYQVTASTTTEIPSVTSRLGHARLVAMSTVSVSCTVPPFSPPVRAATLVDSTSTAFAFTTLVSVRMNHSKGNVIATSDFTSRRICVSMLVDITFLCYQNPVPLPTTLLRRVLVTHHLLLLWERAITTVSIVLGSFSMDTTAIRIGH